jgi:hypothetical protein
MLNLSLAVEIASPLITGLLALSIRSVFWRRKLPNTNFIVGPRFAPFAVPDGRLITGQQQYSGGAIARLVIEALGV